MLRPAKVTMEAILESFHSMGFVTIEKVKSLPLIDIGKSKSDPLPKIDSPKPLPDNNAITYISDHIYVISPN